MLRQNGVVSQGVLHTIADTLSSEKSYVLKRITLDTNDGIFEGKLEFLVNDTQDLKRIITSLQKLSNVEKAYRIEDITIQ